MKKYNLWLEVEAIDDKTDETFETGLMSVKVYSSKSLGRLLYYALALIRRVGVLSDYSDWIQEYKHLSKKEREK